MAEKYEFEYTLTREEWLGLDEVTSRLPGQFDVSARALRRNNLITMAWAVPMIIFCVTKLVEIIGGHPDMRWFGVLLGVIFAGFAVLYYAQTAWHVDAMRRDAIEQSIRNELYGFVGSARVVIDESGIRYATPSIDVWTSWTHACVSQFGNYLVIGSGYSGWCLPCRAVGDDQAVKDLYDKAYQWYEAGQLSTTERIKRYLAERTLFCPQCKYNLHGAAPQPPKHACPECGTPLTIEALMKGKHA